MLSARIFKSIFDFRIWIPTVQCAFVALRCCCRRIYTSLESDVKSWHLLPCSNPNPNRFASVLLLFKSKAAARYWVSGTNTGSGWHWQSNSKRCTRSCSGLKTFRILRLATPSWNGTVGAYFLTRQIWLQIIKLGLLCDGKNLILKYFGKPI